MTTRVQVHDTSQRLIQLANRDPRRAGLLAQRLLATPDLDERLLLAIGAVLLRWERLDATRYALERAASVAADELHILHWRHRRITLMLRQLAGEGRTLQQEWNALAHSCEQHQMWQEWLRARCEQVAQLNMLGPPAEAQALADTLVPFVERYGDLADQGRYWHVAGVAAVACGDIASGGHMLDHAEQIFTSMGQPYDAARVIFEQAWLAMRREQFEHAEQKLTRALRTFSRFTLPYRMALCRRDLGLVAIYAGRYDQAVTELVCARELFAREGRADRAAGCDFNLGVVAHITGFFEWALAAYRRAHIQYLQADDSFHAAIALRNEALVMIAQGQPADALDKIDQLLEAQQRAGNALEYAELIAARGQAWQALKQPGNAERDITLAEQHFRHLGNLPAAGECVLNRAWLLIEHHENLQARQLLEEALPLLSARPVHLWRVEYGFGHIEARAGDTATALAAYRRAVGTIAQLRQRLLSEHSSSRIFMQAQQLHTAALLTAAETGSVEDVLFIAEHQRALVLEQQHARQIGARQEQCRQSALQLGVRMRDDHDDHNAALQEYLEILIQERHRREMLLNLGVVFNLELYQQQLTQAYGDDWSVLYPMLVNNMLILAGVTPDQLYLDVKVLDTSIQALLERAVQRQYRHEYFRDIERLRQPSLPSWSTVTTLALYLLPDWLRARLHPNHRLYIVPSGILSRLPWAALRSENMWLCERAILSYAPALRYVHPLAALADRPALLIGCGNVGERAAPLPAAEASVLQAARHWSGTVHRLVGKQATCATINQLNVNGQLANYGLLHLAGHAQLGTADGLLAHIKLADHDFSLDDLLQLQLQAELVVLAICEGGAGAVLPGDEVLGLHRGFLAAGAAAVLANQWPIQDIGTLAFLDIFYQSLGAGADVALALVQAQRALITHAGPEGESILASPLVWGGFSVTVGNAAYS